MVNTTVHIFLAKNPPKSIHSTCMKYFAAHFHLFIFFRHNLKEGRKNELTTFFSTTVRPIKLPALPWHEKDASLTLIWISKGSLTNAPVVTEHGISERLNFGNKSTTTGKKKKNIQRKMRTHPNTFQFLHWQRTPTSHCLFAAALARLGQSCIGAQERITSQQSHTLSVMQSTCQPSGLALSFGSTHRALQRFSLEPQVQSATINKGMRCPYSTFSSRKYASCSMLTCAGTFLIYVLHTCMTYQNCAIFSIYMSSS